MQPAATAANDGSNGKRAPRRKSFDSVLLGEQPQPLLTFLERSLKIVTANDAALERYKFTRRRFLKLNLRDLHAPTDVRDLAERLSNPPALIADHGIWRQYDSQRVSFRCLLVSRELSVTPEQVRLLMIHELVDPPSTGEDATDRGFARNQEAAIIELDILRRGVRRVGTLLDEVHRQAHALDSGPNASQPEDTALSRLTLGIEKSWRTCHPLSKIAAIRQTGLRRTHVDLSRLLESLLTGRAAGEPQRRIEIDIEPNLIVSADPALLREALDFLVDSSVRSTRTRAVASIEFGQTVHADQCVFFLRDNGIGLMTEHASTTCQNAVGDPDVREETGLALVSIEMAFAHHGGRLWIDAASDVGTTFYFTLPFSGSP